MKNNKSAIIIFGAVLLIAFAGCKKSDEPLHGTWAQLNDFPGTARAGSVSFVIGKYGYLCTGYDKFNKLSEVWQYDPETGSAATSLRLDGRGRTS